MLREQTWTRDHGSAKEQAELKVRMNSITRSLRARGYEPSPTDPYMFAGADGSCVEVVLRPVNGYDLFEIKSATRYE